MPGYNYCPDCGGFHEVGRTDGCAGAIRTTTVPHGYGKPLRDAAPEPMVPLRLVEDIAKAWQHTVDDNDGNLISDVPAAIRAAREGVR